MSVNECMDAIESGMRKQVNINLLRDAAGYQMFCKKCSGVLDMRRTVRVDAYTADGAGAGGFTVCTRCWDAAKERVTGAAAGRNWKLEIVDGREVFARPEAPKEAPAKSTNPIHAKDVKIGGVYRIRHTSGEVNVRILRRKDRLSHLGQRLGSRPGWVALNLKTGREIVIKSAAKLRSEVSR